MRQTQDDITTMFETTLVFLETKNNIWKNRPAFLRAVTSAKAGTAEIRGRSGKQQAPTEGVTEDKEQMRDDLEEKLSVVADALAALAEETKNAELAAKVELNRSVIDRLSASDLKLAAERVLEATAQNLVALADYGITATEQTDLAGAAELFANKKEKPREAIVGRRVETLSLPEAINRVRSIFRNQIDKMMTGFKRTEPDFYTGYFASRVIVNHAATIPPKKPGPPPTPPPTP